MFCYCTGAFSKHSWVTGGFPMKWTGVTGRSDFVCLFICLFVQCGRTFSQQAVMAHCFCFVLKAVNKLRVPTTSNKKKKKIHQILRGDQPSWLHKAPQAERCPVQWPPEEDDQKGFKRQKTEVVPKDGEAVGLAAGPQGTAEGQGSRQPYTVLHQQSNILPLKMAQATQIELGTMSVPEAGIYISCEQNTNLIYSFSPAGRRPENK